MNHALLKATLASSLLLGACASDISPSEQRDDAPATADLPGPGGSQANFFKSAEGYFQSRVDLSSDDWVYLDLDTQTQVFPANPAASDAWDVAHKGSDIKLNGGVSGAPVTGHSAMIYADKVALDESYPWMTLEAAPPLHAVDYHTDVVGSGLLGGNPNNPNSKPDYAFSVYPEADQTPRPVDGAGDYGWFHYSGHLAGSQISARENVAYVVRTVECNYVGMRITGYTSGTELRYDLRPISGSPCADRGDDSGGVVGVGKANFTTRGSATLVHVDASDEEAWVYLDLINAVQSQPTSPADDTTWDVALKRSDIKMNSGASGSQDVALHDMLDADWAITQSSAQANFHVDDEGALAFVTYPLEETESRAACGNINGDFGWYYYSGFCNDGAGVHHISPREVVYILRARDGQQFKLRLLNYYSSDGESGHLQLEYEALGS